MYHSSINFIPHYFNTRYATTITLDTNAMQAQLSVTPVQHRLISKDALPPCLIAKHSKSKVQQSNIKAAGTFMCLCMLSHTNTSLLWRIRVHWKPFENHYIHYGCVCAKRATGWWEQLSGLRLVHRIDSQCYYLAKSAGGGCGAGVRQRWRGGESDSKVTLRAQQPMDFMLPCCYTHWIYKLAC